MKETKSNHKSPEQVIKYSKCALMMIALMFITALSIITFSEVLAITGAYLFYPQIQEIVGNKLQMLMDLYYNDRSVQNTMDMIQLTGKCCGKIWYFDWLILKNSKYFLPASCCEDYESVTGNPKAKYENVCSKFHARGCLEEAIKMVYRDARLDKENFLHTFVFIFLQLIIVIISIKHAKSLQKAKTQLNSQEFSEKPTLEKI